MSIWLIGSYQSSSSTPIKRALASAIPAMNFADAFADAYDNTKTTKKSWLELCNKILLSSDNVQQHIADFDAKKLSKLLDTPKVNYLYLLPSPGEVLFDLGNLEGISEEQIETTLNQYTKAIDEALALKELHNNLHIVINQAALQSPQQLTNALSSLEKHLDIALPYRKPPIICSLYNNILKSSEHKSFSRFLALEAVALTPQIETPKLLNGALELQSLILAPEEHSSLKDELDNALSINALLTSQIKDINDELDDSKNHLATLSELKDDLKARLLHKEAEVDKLTYKYAPIEEYCNELEDQAIANDKKTIALEGELKLANAELSKLDALNEIKEALALSQQEVERLNNLKYQLSIATESEDALTKQNTALSTRISELEARILNANQEHRTLISKMQNKLDRATSHALIQSQHIEALTSKLDRPIATNITCKDFMRRARCETLEITDTYDEGGYRDLKLNMYNLQLADNRVIEKVSFKLFQLENGDSGIELREDNNTPGLLRFTDEHSDQYGRFLKLFAIDSAANKELNQQLKQALCASDLLLILSTLSIVDEALSFGDVRVSCELQDGQIAHWKSIAEAITLGAKQQANVFAIDSLELLDSSVDGDNENLLIKFNHLVLDHSYHSQLIINFAAHNTNVPHAMAEHLVFEIRALECGQPQLQVWPVGESDEQGQVYRVRFNTQEAVFSSLLDLSPSDRQLVLNILQNYHNWIDALKASEDQLPHSFDEYQHNATLIQQALRPKPQERQRLKSVAWRLVGLFR